MRFPVQFLLFPFVSFVLQTAAAQPQATESNLQNLKIPTFLDPLKNHLKVVGSTEIGLLKASLVNLNDPMTACVATPYENTGQSWVEDLSTGGITQKAQTAPYSDGTTAPAKAPIFKDIFGVFPNDLETGSTPVTLFIVDRFSKILVKMKEPGLQAADLPMKHGELVTAHILSLLQDADYKIYRGASSLTAKPQNSKLPNITIIKIKLPEKGEKGPYFTDSELLSSLSSFTKLKIPGSRVVFNMSFALLNCESMTHYRSIRDKYAKLKPPKRYSLTDFINDTASNNGKSPKQVLNELTTLPPSNPLRTWLSSNAPQQALVVASSGNYGLSVSTWPAAAPSVVGVGANLWNGTRSNWSDQGDTWSTGEWFTIPYAQLKTYCTTLNTCVTEDILAPTFNDYLHFGYRGTSFSSPSVALFLALRRGSPQESCLINTGTGFKRVPKTPSGFLKFSGSNSMHKKCN